VRQTNSAEQKGVKGSKRGTPKGVLRVDADGSAEGLRAATKQWVRLRVSVDVQRRRPVVQLPPGILDRFDRLGPARDGTRGVVIRGRRERRGEYPVTLLQRALGLDPEHRCSGVFDDNHMPDGNDRVVAKAGAKRLLPRLTAGRAAVRVSKRRPNEQIGVARSVPPAARKR